MEEHRLLARPVRVVLLLALILMGAAASTGGGTARAASAGIKLSLYAVDPGTHLTVTGNGFHAGDNVAVAVESAAAGANSLQRVFTTNVTANGGGGFSRSIVLPNGTKPGFYEMVATDANGNIAFQLLQVPLDAQLKAGQSGARIYPLPGQIVRISGINFNAGETVRLTTAFPQYSGNTVNVTRSVKVQSNGTFGPVAFRVPWDSKDGYVPLTVTTAAGTTSASLQIAHHPFAVLGSSNVTAGTTLLAQLTGFAPNSRLAVVTTVRRTDGAQVRLAKTVRTGSRGITGVSLTLPNNTRPGNYVVAATVLGARQTVAARYSVSSAANPGPTPTATGTTPPAPPARVTLQVAPRAVVPGANAQVLGSGFPAHTQVVITAAVSRNGSSVQNVRVTVRTDGHGNFVANMNTPGDAAAGWYRVTAQGGGRSAHASLHIQYLRTAIVSVPAQAIPGTTIVVSGFGYAANTTVTVTLGGATLGTATTQANGTFKQQFTVPSGASTGMESLAGKDNSGRSASFSLQIYRKIATHFYFASIYTGPGFHESLLFTNDSGTDAQVHITYQRGNGTQSNKTVTVKAHSRLTHDVNGDLGNNVTAGAVVSADVPIAAERMVTHGVDGAIDSGAPAPAWRWFFANGNTSHQYHEEIAVQNPNNAWARVTLQVQPTHSKVYYLRGTLKPHSVNTWNLNASSHDAVGVIVSGDHQIVANRTILIHNGISSKTGVEQPSNHWYFAAGPDRSNTRHWIGVINTTNQPSHLVMQVYNAAGAVVATVNKDLKPYDRQGFLMNRVAGQTEVAVTVSTSQPSISEQSTFVNQSHDAHADTFGVTTPAKTAQFAAATTWSGQDNLLGLFNPNAQAAPIVVQFVNAHGGYSEQTYIVAPFAHAYVDVGKVQPNSQLGLVAVSNYPFVALDRQLVNNGNGAMISLGTQH